MSEHSVWHTRCLFVTAMFRLRSVALIALVLAASSSGRAESIPNSRAAESEVASPVPAASNTHRFSAAFVFAPWAGTDCRCDGYLTNKGVSIGAALGYSYRLLPNFSLGLRASFLARDELNTVAVPVMFGFPIALSERVELEPALGLGWRRWSAGQGGWSANGAGALISLGLALAVGRRLFLVGAASVEAGTAVIRGGNAYVAGQSLLAFDTPFDLGLRYAF
ncbi:MAG TPA: hypothetical protein VJV79_39235 [Polyangiaceae bacterium]|nr:hypothetical protein [Polyangiaceae bacterium]